MAAPDAVCAEQHGVTRLALMERQMTTATNDASRRAGFFRRDGGSGFTQANLRGPREGP